LFKRLTQGVYVIGVAHGEVRNAFTAAWVMQVSFDPLLLALSINPQHSSYRLLKEGRTFSVNVLLASLANHGFVTISGSDRRLRAVATKAGYLAVARRPLLADDTLSLH
jgi:flavin reductase (DIM6/NTAB) family NADH-FMN oxidoreductase RutF